ncbi:HepT-like ribonuclease domain-containing protein [Pseudanabaena galeata UHCC 0370]|uniref:HepT-like ribonuclease domain-containing protein n=1 Tax=Pseudanabaena galeata UHCC 0370 TaxID=3110310 RepID=A0ABU5TLC4_9CYAN|nr:HepT-like ribonuclease domain-containing protein [Pseudanabaena galeata]MEA5479057.1 HepT-like ribonuclease domain-containing protein [Pseudanabaena galeata UHCC 0370]
MKDDRLYLVHVRDCLVKIQDYTKDGSAAFMENGLIQDAVIRNLEIMGESIKKLPAEWKSWHPEIEWVQIGNFRNVLAHDYLDIDLDVVWGIIENFLPDLQRAIASICSQVLNEQGD